jgi:hypothetical protein
MSWDLLYNALRANRDDGGGDKAYCEALQREEEEGEAGYLYGRKIVEARDVGEGVWR